MQPDQISARKVFFDERREVLWEVDVTPPDSTNFRFLLFTDCYKKVVGVGHEEMAGKTLPEALPPETTPLVQGKYAQCVNERRQITYSEHLNVGGQWRWWRTTIKPYLNNDGEIHRLLGTAVEIIGVEAKLRNAMKAGELAVHYQPICDIQNPSLPTAGYEALIRWPGSGFSPADFLPVAKQAGIMPQITEFVLLDASYHLHRLQGKQWIAVNVSDCVSAAKVIKAADGYRLNPNWLRFEITEGTTADNDLIEEYEKIISLGHVFELDDYGTERSNAFWLGIIPIGAIKLDAQFVVNAYDSPNKAAVCYAAQALSEKFTPKLDVIAEGIETEQDLVFARQLGFHYGQGWLLGRPQELS